MTRADNDGFRPIPPEFAAGPAWRPVLRSGIKSFHRLAATRAQCGVDSPEGHSRIVETRARAERRDLALFGSVAEIRRRYAARYVPGQRLYLAECRPEENAEWVVDNRDPARPFLAGPDRTGGAAS